MKETPIIFNTEMVRAILDGRKTMTRRIVKPQPKLFYTLGETSDPINPEKTAFKVMDKGGRDYLMLPPYQPGDRLWVKETWAVKITGDSEDPGFSFTYKSRPEDYIWNVYPTDDDRFELINKYADKNGWQSSLFMPREAARLTLDVISVRTERLQDITDADCWAEGIDDDVPFGTAETKFADFWDSSYAAPKPVEKNGIITHYESYPWEDIQETRMHLGLPWIVCGNPYIWRVEYDPRLEV